jgi:hypothetical protein
VSGEADGDAGERESENEIDDELTQRTEIKTADDVNAKKCNRVVVIKMVNNVQVRGKSDERYDGTDSKLSYISAGGVNAVSKNKSAPGKKAECDAQVKLD